MELNQDEVRFLGRRRKLISAWRYAGPLTLLLIFGLAIFLGLRSPMMVNPFAIIERLEAGTLAQSTLEMMAMFVPLLVITICFILIVLIQLMYVAFSNEKKYLQIIDLLKNADSTR